MGKILNHLNPGQLAGLESLSAGFLPLHEARTNASNHDVD